MTVTVLGLGEAGSILGADLVEMGITVNAWDPKPKCVPPGVKLATSDYAAINGADLILSVNLASVAADVARSSLATLTPGQVFADLNTASPGKKQEIAKTLSPSGVLFADVALLAPVPGPGLRTPALVSGPGAQQFHDMLTPYGMPVTVLGDRVGNAVGPARMVLCGQDDNLMVHAVMEHLQPGEVLVLTMLQPAPVALIGELLTTQARVRGAAAILVDAAGRDVAELVELGLLIWTRFVRVKGATKTKIGQLKVPVTVGDTIIDSGDIVVLDADGAVSVKQIRLAEVLAKAEARLERETQLRVRLEAGEMSYDIRGLRPVVEKQNLSYK